MRPTVCLFCGGSSGKEAVNAEVISAIVNVEPGQTTAEPTGYVVCPECLARDQAAVIAEILSTAAWHRERAAELEAIATDLPPLPSRLDWEAANDAADQEYCDAMDAKEAPGCPGWRE